MINGQKAFEEEYHKLLSDPSVDIKIEEFHGKFLLKTYKYGLLRTQQTFEDPIEALMKKIGYEILG